MPIYEYECDGCNEVFEVRQKMSDPPPARHACGSQQVHRVLSATTFVLKGTGWYKTDYADKPRPKEGGDGSHKSDDGPTVGDAKSNADGGSRGGDPSPATPPADSSGTAAAREGKKADSPPPKPSTRNDKGKTPAA